MVGVKLLGVRQPVEPAADDFDAAAFQFSLEMMFADCYCRLLETRAGEDCFYYRKYLAGLMLICESPGLSRAVKEKRYGVRDFLSGGVYQGCPAEPRAFAMVPTTLV